jgi:hypothetical protein
VRHGFVAEIDDHRIDPALDPAEERIQVAIGRPDRGNTIPTIQLLLENCSADLSRFYCEVSEAQIAALATLGKEILGYAATGNSSAMKNAWLRVSSLGSYRTLPFRII